MSTKYQNGAFCFTRISNQYTPLTPADIARLAGKHGIDPSICPQYAGDRQQVSRAITHAKAGLKREGWLLTDIKTTQHEVLYGISSIEKDQALERVDHSFVDRVRWTDEGGNGAHIHGSHHAAQQADTAYQALRGRICAGDWTSTLTDYLLRTCYAQPMRESGVIYWVPPPNVSQLHTLTAFLKDVGISLIICEIEADTMPVIQQAAQEGLADQLAELEAKVAAFSGEEKPSNYKHRLEEFQALRARCLVYRASLGIGVEQAQAMLDSLEAQVSRLLDIRENIVVHRSGKSSAKGEQPGAVDTMAAVFGEPVTYAPLGDGPTLSAGGNTSGGTVWQQAGFNW